MFLSMKSLKVFLILLTIMISFALNIASLQLEEVQEQERVNNLNEIDQESWSEDGLNERFLSQKYFKTRRQTCDKYPRICRAKGSPGPYCCKKKCVNVLSDRANCGACGKKCKYNEICCHGKCVNPSFSRRHCGGCNNRCSNGSFCTFGLCNYA